MSMSPAEYALYKDTITKYEAALEALAAERHRNDGFAADGKPAWLADEILAMWKRVNTDRRAHGRDLVDLETIERIESSAAGHIDYRYKFALRCADLVHRTPDPAVQ